jgi:hypothetical protein
MVSGWDGLSVLGRALAILFEAGLCVLAVTKLHPYFQRHLEQVRFADAREQGRLQGARNMLLYPSCACAGQIAADYGGWHGSVHTFSFANAEFGEAFESSNHGRILRDGQIHH